MGWWRVMIRSEGWRLEREPHGVPQGFFVTRCVDAEGMEAAAEAAKAEVMKDLAGLATPDREETPMLHAIKIAPLTKSELRSGFVFYGLEKAGPEGSDDPTFRIGPTENRGTILDRLRMRWRMRDR